MGDRTVERGGLSRAETVTKPAIVVAFSDTHVNSTAGLLPPRVKRDDGSTHLSNKSQRWLWKQYLALWAEVAKRKEQLGARVIVVFNGDGPDRNRHSGGYDLIVMSRADIIRWTVATLEPAKRVADTLIVNRGTPAHEGGTGELSELVAEKIGATPDPKSGNHSWWNTVLDVEDRRFLLGHRPISNSTREHTRGAGAQRTAADLEAAYVRMGDRCPDFGIFAHVHHAADSGTNRRMRVMYCPPWKLCDSYGHSIGFGPKVEAVGAWIVTVREGEPASVELWKRQPPAVKAVKV